MKKWLSALLVVVCVLSLCSCSKEPTDVPDDEETFLVNEEVSELDMRLSDFMDIMKDSFKRVYDVFPKIGDDSPVIKDQYLVYDQGQHAAYLECVYENKEDYITEYMRVRELGFTEEYADDSTIDSETVEGAVKLSFVYSKSVEAYMYDSGLMTYALFYEAEQRVVYIAVSENPLYTYSQFLPQEYVIVDDLHKSAETFFDTDSPVG